MNTSLFKTTLLATAVTFASFGMTACNDSENDSSKKVDTTAKNDIDTQIQAKQSDQVVVFKAIKTIQGGFGDDTAKKTFANGVKSKIAATAQSDISGWLDGLLANKDKTAAQNVAGKLARTPKENKPRSIVVDEKAHEYGQLVKKGLIGAYQLKNALAEAGKLRGAGADNQAILANVTAYLIGDYAELAKGKGDKSYAGNEFDKYLKRVASNKNFSTIEDDLYAALNAAKANIEDNDKFGANIMQAIALAQKAVAVRAVHYLKDGAELENEEAGKFGNAAHGVSEGLGLLYSLQFTYNTETHTPYYTKAEIDEFIGGLDLWNKADAKAKLLQKAEEVAQKFGFDASKA